MSDSTPSKSVMLAVDDRPDNLFVLEQLMAESLPDCRVVTATSAREGLAIAASTRIDGALIDVQMPEMDGLEMCRRLKADVATRDIHVILVTAHGVTTSFRTEGLDAGADDFISRPIYNAELIARISAMLRVRRAEDELREMNARLEELVQERTGELRQELAKRQQAEEALLRQQRSLTLNHQIANVFLTSVSEAFFSDVLDVVLKALGSRFGFFGYIDDAGDLVCPSLTRDVWDRCEIADKSIVFSRALFGGSLFGRSLTEKRSLLANEGLVLPEGHLQLANALAVPILHRGALVGQFVVANRTGGYDEDDRQLLESAAAQTAPILSAQLDKERHTRKHAELEEQYRHSQKMEAIGQLAGGVAHDFNNLLTVINTYAELALDDLREGDPLKADMQQVVDAGQRATSLTRQLLAFSRKQVMEVRVLDLNETVVDLEKMLRRLLGEDVELFTSLARDLGRVRADPGQLEQVLMNLAINARDAMVSGGRLGIETANVELGDAYAREHLDTVAGPHVMLAVSDDGAGISVDIKERIFEPFFTTKEQGQGTGLGLATVYGIVKQSGGHIVVQSELGQGTTFEVYLPRVEDEKTERRARTDTVVPRGTETVLIVEDEDAVRALASRVLASGGYRVIAAANGGEALLECERRAGEIDLLLTDVVMPKMSGRELADRLVAICPDLRVLYMSGYTDDVILRRGVHDEGAHFIAKPFNAAALLKKVRMVVESD